MKDETRGKTVDKPKIEIVLGKTEKFDSLMSASINTAAPQVKSIVAWEDMAILFMSSEKDGLP
ncbi:hypothetical protein Dimus_008343, partial [Dionaea muscipula]